MILIFCIIQKSSLVTKIRFLLYNRKIQINVNEFIYYEPLLSA